MGGTPGTYTATRRAVGGDNVITARIADWTQAVGHVIRIPHTLGRIPTNLQCVSGVRIEAVNDATHQWDDSFIYVRFIQGSDPALQDCVFGVS